MGLTVRVGVEPTEPRGSLVFKSSALFMFISTLGLNRFRNLS